LRERNAGDGVTDAQVRYLVTRISFAQITTAICLEFRFAF